jgi:hypothetical protein
LEIIGRGVLKVAFSLIGKGKGIPVDFLDNLDFSRHFLDNRLTDGGEVVSPTRRPPFTPPPPPGRFLVLISVRG